MTLDVYVEISVLSTSFLLKTCVFLSFLWVTRNSKVCVVLELMLSSPPEMTGKNCSPNTIEGMKMTEKRNFMKKNEAGKRRQKDQGWKELCSRRKKRSTRMKDKSVSRGSISVQITSPGMNTFKVRYEISETWVGEYFYTNVCPRDIINIKKLDKDFVLRTSCHQLVSWASRERKTTWISRW